MYINTSKKSKIKVPNKRLRNQLKNTIYFAPLIRATLRKEYVKFSICNDASMKAEGACYTRDTPGCYGRNMSQQEIVVCMKH